VQAKHKGRDHAEVATASAQSPEEVWVFVIGGPDLLACGGHEVDGKQVVDREPVFAHQPPDPTTQGQTGDSRMADDAACGGKTVGLCLTIDATPKRTALDPRRSGGWIDQHGAHGGQVDDESVVTYRSAGDVVPSTPNCDLEVIGTGIEHGCRHVCGPTAPGDQPGVPVDGAVPHGSGSGIVGVPWLDQLAVEPFDME
jgi:hypothetical protein